MDNKVISMVDLYVIPRRFQ